MASETFLRDPDPHPSTAAMLDADRSAYGFVMNLTRVWAHQPDVHRAYVALVTTAADAAGLTMRDRGVLVTALASTMGDSYCSIAWGGRLAEEAGDPAVPVAVLSGSDEGLEERDRALAAWARAVVRDPGGTTGRDVDRLRAAGLDDAQVVAATVYVAARLAFSTVNGALGARPDAGLRGSTPPEVLDAVTWGRPIEPADD
ncbi:hypothetical protein [Nocardioides abyssi]|uniref:Uncharacterized protein n=1 Tax=Nocardioides abyssi TaxID=3058370 RepID=A0ABT8ERJ1_9ACTN|nr:hypothetical protein [Nocardioides abyssi]MDN4160763.1 hypothetical protein [Nocardioides abyssi]